MNRSLMYLDQNYASRISKFLIGDDGHAHFGLLHDVLTQSDICIPPSPFHVLELLDGYLKPSFQQLYGHFSRGYWVRHWQDVVKRQAIHQRVDIEDFLTTEGDWESAAETAPLTDIVTLAWNGSFVERKHAITTMLQQRLQPLIGEVETPFVRILSGLLTFRSLNEERQARDSDLIDLLMAATVRPYVQWLCTDRFMREGLEKIGEGEGVFSGRRQEVHVLIQRFAPGTSSVGGAHGV
ncbi:MAG: hypothetical protein CL920_19630 [Deltaproteobacteria bacterium]|nr:hypothetical protein [Deltaproteobacteria bacterium]